MSPPLAEPSARIVFNSIEAEDPGYLILNFSLEAENPVPSAGKAKIGSWRVELNGQRAGTGFSLDTPGGDIFPVKAASEPGENADSLSGSASFPLRLNMDLASLAGAGLAPADDYKLNLVMELSFIFDSEPPARIEVSGLAAFPGLRPPVFNITSIAILKAELINTRFRVGLKIDNPNPFPLELSAFSYELYGNGRIWADGQERNVLKVNGKSSLQGNLFLLMNFINMKRDLLDQVINLEDVNYRFSGDALVISGVEYLPQFKTSFNLSGYSPVLDN